MGLIMQFFLHKEVDMAKIEIEHSPGDDPITVSCGEAPLEKSSEPSNKYFGVIAKFISYLSCLWEGK